MVNEVTLSSEHMQAVSDRANRINDSFKHDMATREFAKAIKVEARNAAVQVVQDLQEASLGAVKKIVSLSKSKDDDMAYKASTFIVDHVIGKAMQKSISRVENVSIDVLAD